MRGDDIAGIIDSRAWHCMVLGIGPGTSCSVQFGRIGRFEQKKEKNRQLKWENR